MKCTLTVKNFPVRVKLRFDDVTEAADLFSDLLEKGSGAILSVSPAGAR